MAAPMPWLLFRYLLGELLKVFAISASVLVMVTAFGAAIKPLAAEDLIGPLQTAKYILLAIVPMLQFAIPFAAAFAATLVLHRMTTDNEILAAAVSGLSYGRILAPMTFMGVALLVVMVVLTQWIIPRFWGLMDRNLAADVPRVVMASIKKGVPFRLDRYQIYADRGRAEPNPETGIGAPGMPRPVSRLVLSRVAAAELDDQGRLVTDVTARHAVIDVYRVEGRTLLMLALADTVAYQSDRGELISLGEMTLEPFLVPGGLRDEPIFLTQGELVAAYRSPDRFTYIRDAGVALAAAVQERQILASVGERLAAQGRIDLVEGDTRVQVTADSAVEGRLLRRDGRPVLALQEKAGVPMRRIAAAAASLVAAPGFRADSPVFDLVFEDCRVEDLEHGGAPNEGRKIAFRSHQVEGVPIEGMAAMQYEALLARADGAAPGPVAARADVLRARVEDVRLEIRARLHQRYAMSFTAILLPMLGGVLAIWLRNSLPLVIYVWAFAPSILDILLISGGDHMIRQGQLAAGTCVMWAGNGILLALLLWAFWRMARN